MTAEIIGCQLIGMTPVGEIPGFTAEHSSHQGIGRITNEHPRKYAPRPDIGVPKAGTASAVTVMKKPRKLLPVSPMKIFAGGKLKINRKGTR